MNDIQEPWNLEVKAHCISQFKLRTDTRVSDMQAANRIRTIVAHGVEQEIKDEVKRVRQLLKHSINGEMNGARYFRESAHKGMMVVLVGRSIVTSHGGEDGKWSPKLNEAKV